MSVCGLRIVRVDEQRRWPATCGTRSDSSSSRLGISSTVRKLTPVMLPPGSRKTGDKAGCDRITPDNRQRSGLSRSPLFAASAERVAAACRQSRRPSDRRDRRPRRTVDRNGPPPSDIRSPRFGPRHSRSRSVPGGMPQPAARSHRPIVLRRNPMTGIAFCARGERPSDYRRAAGVRQTRAAVIAGTVKRLTSRAEYSGRRAAGA